MESQVHSSLSDGRIGLTAGAVCRVVATRCVAQFARPPRRLELTCHLGHWPVVPPAELHHLRLEAVPERPPAAAFAPGTPARAPRGFGTDDSLSLRTCPLACKPM